MTILTYILAFLVAIGILVAVHEYGHFWMARRMGIKVLRFSIVPNCMPKPRCEPT